MEQNLSELLLSLPIFRNATREVVNTLITNSPNRIARYDRGELIALQGSRVKNLLILLSGKVRAQMTSQEGRRLVVDNIDAPEILASAFVYSTDSKYPVSIEAIEPCTLWHLDKEYFIRFMSCYPMVMRAFLESISDRCNFLSQKLNTLNLQSLRERIINYLHKYGSLGKQEDLALLLGVARPSLSRLLSDLVDEGILLKFGQNYQLRNK